MTASTSTEIQREKYIDADIHTYAYDTCVQTLGGQNPSKLSKLALEVTLEVPLTTYVNIYPVL